MNRFKTTLLLGGLTALVLAAGYYFGGQQGALIALILSAVINLGSYWFSDKIVLALLILTPIIATLLHLAVSRSREYLADETGSHISKDPKSLASALKKLHQSSRLRPLVGEPKYEATAHIFIVNPFKPSLLMSLFSTHPPVEERVKKLEALKI